MKKIGTWLKSWRYDLNMNQKQFAEELNVSIRIIQNWETRGTSDTTIMLLKKIRQQEKEIDRLKKQLEDSQKTFILPK